MLFFVMGTLNFDIRNPNSRLHVCLNIAWLRDLLRNTIFRTRCLYARLIRYVDPWVLKFNYYIVLEDIKITATVIV